MKIGRNAPCSCGSSKKYKNCCERAAANGKGDWSKVGMIAVGVALALGVAGFVGSILVADDAGADGRVWSAEHGHWHGPDGLELGASARQQQAQPQPQPPGDAPAGKTWSAEHGHWHDIE